MADRFAMQQHEDGQIYISEGREQMLHALIRSSEDVALQVGTKDTVEIQKDYGPLVFQSIRVKLDLDTCEWIIERQDAGINWREVTRIPGQLETDFPNCPD